MFLSSYRNTVLNQSACVFALGYFLNSDKTWVFDQSERAQSPIYVISNGNRTEWSPIRSVIIPVIITKSDDRAAGVRFVYHEHDYRLNWTKRSPITITYNGQ